ncbi:MAG: NUDIX hydrolase [Candidatus Melainabacteria bacterium]|nr:NUDIX hydrolase [Candidatus Melainabacteria bacterium]
MALFTRENTISSNKVFEGKIVNLRVDQLQGPEGKTFSREVVEHNGGVVIACQPQPGTVILIRQYRYTIDMELLELPAGRLEAGEEPLLAAQRELLEETGYEAQSWKPLTSMYSAPGFCNELLHLFRAQNIVFQGKALDEDEETEVIIVPVQQAWQYVLNGQVRDAKTIAGIALLLGPNSLS